MKKVDIYLVDDHSLFREGLKLLLSNLDFIGKIFEANNGEEFIQGLKDNPVDIALLDIEMPVMNGIEAAKKARQIQPSVKILALSMYSDKNYYLSMIDAGACGFLLKNSNFEEVEKAITDVCNDKSYISIEILNDILKHPDRASFNVFDSELTERETEILLLICRGFTNSEIAARLFLSKRTVDKHRENLLQKTQSKNTANLVIYAIKNGLLQI
ncbi:two component transcriptional regulator, LuxR family [Tangfeifania diversioriginum]|uniref:Two component transcriptional regulator, LuxR family n=1 Tax=Tangfeifania diversioriginum TaxID=1168035 RepID=A0A1M6H530_9BACT|nr:response regulator transcription factor [Tangfeifania diversioriginum]SHJ17357.1 two component transcriptional regulator, LuxR family [Tangfeifania diversioriginum]